MADVDNSDATVAQSANQVEQALGVPDNFFVYSTKMFGFIKASPPEYAHATVLGVLVLGALIPFLVLQQIVTRKRYTTVTGQMKTGAVPLRRWRRRRSVNPAAPARR